MLATFIKIEEAAFIIGLLLAISYQAMVGGIRIQGLLSDSVEDGKPGLGRIQLLAFVLIQAGAYAGQVMANPHKFPAVPVSLLVVYGGSNIVYLGAKVQPLVQSFLKGG
jgi:hypothetical protein